MRAYADVFKALADETRLTMLALLFVHGELCVCDFEAVLEISQSKASRHLRYLKNAGLLDDRRDGIWVHYEVAKRPSSEAAQILEANRRLIPTLVDDGLPLRLARWLEQKSACGSCGATNVK